MEAMNNMHTPQSETLRSSPYFIFTLLFLLYMFDYMDRQVVSVLFPFLKQDWGITDKQCGLLVSAVYWSILVFTLPIGILIDRWSRKKSIGIMAIFWSGATLACAFTKNFRHLFIARSAIGLGEAGYAPGGTAMISAFFSKEKRAKMLGIWNSAIPLGSALGVVVGGIIAKYFGWRHAFGLVALPGVLVAILFFYVKDYKTIELTKRVDSGSGKTDDKMRWPDIARQFMKNKTLIFNNLAFAANTFVTTSLLNWLPSYFHRTQDIPMSQAGPKTGAVMVLAIIGAPLGGYLADRWRQNRKNARLLFPAISSIVTTVLLVFAFQFFQGNIQYAVLMGVGISIIAFVPAGVAVTQDVVHPGLRATSLSVNIVIQHILGSSLGPPVIGALSDAYGLNKAMVFLPLFTFLAGILFFVGSFFYNSDVSKVEDLESSTATI